ncbi:MAG: hypothetical protein JWM89_559 [Acidimicrobiales bacterium]|nr:hypothetical protein [Acidimicrobiales bacterium]
MPLGGTGSTRLLDGIDTALLGDHLPDGFLPTLHRAGLRYLLVRNDLDLPRTEGPSPTSVRRVLATASPHLDRVASFGPSDDARRNDGRATPEPGAPSLGRYRTIDVYAVPHAVDRVTSYPAASSLVVGGGPEAVLQLPASATDGRATVLAVDEPRTGLPDSIRVATDTARRRDVIFGAIRNNATYTLTPGERSPVTAEPPEDRWPGDGPVGLSVAHVDGAATLQADEPRTDLLDPEGQPASAFDGSPTTSWLPATPAEGRWIEVGLDRARTVSDVTVAIPSTTGARVGSVVVTTDAGSRTVTIGADGSVRVPVDHSTTRVRVTIASVIGGVEVRPLGLSEIRIGGLHIGRSVVAAPPGRGGAAAPATAAWFSRLRRDRFDRFRSDEEGRLARTVALTGGEGLELTGTATSTPGPALDRLLATAVPSDGSRVIAGSGAPSIRATASSRWRDQPVFDATAAVDGDPATAWVSDSEVSTPALRLSWPGAVPVDRIRIRTAPVPGTDPVPTVSVLVDGRRYLRDIPAGGWIRIPKTRVDQLVLAFPRPDPTDTGARLVGILEVDLAGLHRAPAARPDRDAATDLPCGSGPVIRFDGRSIATRAQATAGALLDGAPVPWQACEALDVRSGTHRIEGPAGGPLAVATASLTPGGGLPVPAAARSVSIRSWGREHRTLAVGAGSATILATTENVNRGWRATLGGRTLTPIRVDGWRQGWLLPAGTRGTIHLDYAPGTGQRAGLVVGAIAVIGLLALAFVGRTRRGGAAARSAWSVPGEQPWPVPALLGSAVLAGVALGGPAVLLLLPVLALPRRDRSLPLVAMGATVAAGIVAFVSPHAAIINHEGTLSLPAQLFAVVAVLALAASSVPESISPSAGAGSTRSNHGPTGRRRRRSDTTPEGTD